MPLAINFTNQSSDTLQVDDGFNNVIAYVLPTQVQCVSNRAVILSPSQGGQTAPDSSVELQVFSKNHPGTWRSSFDRWISLMYWDFNRYPQVTVTYTANHQWSWSVGAAPCAAAINRSGFAGASVSIHVTSIARTNPDSCVVNYSMRTLPDTLLSLGVLSYDVPGNPNHGSELVSGMLRDSLGRVGVTIPVTFPTDTLALFWQVWWDTTKVSLSAQSKLVCGASLP